MLLLTLPTFPIILVTRETVNGFHRRLIGLDERGRIRNSLKESVQDDRANSRAISGDFLYNLNEKGTYVAETVI